MNQRRDNPCDLPVADLELIDRICVEFEHDLLLGLDPQIESFLNRVEKGSDTHRLLLAELVALEVEFCRSKGEQPGVDEYLNRFPQRSDVIEQLFQQEQVSAETLRNGFGKIGRTPPVSELSIESRYVITRFHARGGLGAVFVANDANVSREVAVKFSRFRNMDEAQCDRFQREADITGRLEHPGIVPVYSIKGQDNSPPCYVMRFVEGETLQESVQRFHSNKSLSTGTEKFSGVKFRQLAQRLISICNTISYAHGRGVIHRDIKPRNIMLGRFGETLLLDWGLAKAIGTEEISGLDNLGESGTVKGGLLGNSTATKAGQVMGTPAFASPEQLLGQLDEHTEKCDIYSLGATFYFVLTGKPPIASGTSNIPTRDDFEAIRPAVEIDSRVPRILSAICSRAMSINPDDRYASAEILANDLEQFLADEPVDVYSEPWSARGRRWVRKHYGLSSAVATGLLVGLIGLTAGAIMLSNKNRQYSDLNTSLIDKNSQLESANESIMIAQDQTLYALRRLANNNAIGRWMARQESLGENDREYLEQIITGFEAFANLQGDDARSRELRAEGLAQVGSLRVMLGQQDEAVPALEQCLAVCSSGGPDEPMTPATRMFAARAEGFLGEIYYQKDIEKSKPFFLRAVIHFSQLCDAGFRENESRKMLARFEARLGELNLKAGNAELSKDYFARSLANLEKLVESDPENQDFRYILAFHHMLQGDHMAAIELLSALAEENTEDPRYRFDLGVALVNQAYILGSENKRLESIEMIKESNQHFETLANEYPLVPRYRLWLAEGIYRLARQYVVTSGSATAGSDNDPVVEFRKALGIVNSLYLADPDSMVVIHKALLIESNFAKYLEFQSAGLSEIKPHLEQCVKLNRRLHQLDPNLESATAVGTRLNNLGRILLKNKRYEAAIEKQEQAIESVAGFSSAEQKKMPAIAMLKEATERLAMAHLENRNFESAIEILEQMLDDETASDETLTSSLIAICIAGNSPEKGWDSVRELLELEPGASARFNLACAAALASSGLEDENPALAEKAALASIDLLKDLVADEFFVKTVNQTKVRETWALDSLRERNDFKRLQRRLNSTNRIQ